MLLHLVDVNGMLNIVQRSAATIRFKQSLILLIDFAKCFHWNLGLFLLLLLPSDCIDGNGHAKSCADENWDEAVLQVRHAVRTFGRNGAYAIGVFADRAAKRNLGATVGAE